MSLTSAERQARYREKHPEKIKAYRLANKEKYMAWRKNNQERINALARKKYVKKPKRQPFDEKSWRAEWKEKNLDWYLARSAQFSAERRAKQRLATPAWANKFYIREIYHLARLRTKHSGIKHHVDHIIPIYGETVCGLHTEQNLQVIPATENIRKSNALLETVAIPREYKFLAAKEAI
jgi:hypothetical protein